MRFLKLVCGATIALCFVAVLAQADPNKPEHGGHSHDGANHDGENHEGHSHDGRSHDSRNHDGPSGGPTAHETSVGTGNSKESPGKEVVPKEGLAKEGLPREGLDRSEKMKQRLEQLFIWRVSDRLQLTPSEESKFTDEFHRLSDERAKLSQQLDSTLDQIEKEKIDSDKSSKLLSDYTSALKRYNSVQSKEMDVMSHLFGTKKMVQYVLLKREMTQKFKDVLSASAAPQRSNDKPMLKEPEVIEQK